MCLGGCVGVESVQVKEQSAFNARVTGVRYERERGSYMCMSIKLHGLCALLVPGNK